MKKPLLLLFLVTATPVLAGPREDTLDGINRCRAILEDRLFLDCLYGAAQPLRASLGLAPASPGQIRLVPPSTPPTVVPVPMRPVSASPPPMAMAMAAPRPAPSNGAIRAGTKPGFHEWLETFSFDGKGRFTVTLGNGEIWRQDAGDAPRAAWRGRANDYYVEVIADSPRTGQLRVRGENNVYRVTKLN